MQNEFCTVNLFNLLKTRFHSLYLTVKMKWLALNHSWRCCPQRDASLVLSGNGLLYLLCASSSPVTLIRHSSERWWGKQSFISLFHGIGLTQIVLVAHLHVQSGSRRVSYKQTQAEQKKLGQNCMYIFHGALSKDSENKGVHFTFLLDSEAPQRTDISVLFVLLCCWPFICWECNWSRHLISCQLQDTNQWSNAVATWATLLVQINTMSPLHSAACSSPQSSLCLWKFLPNTALRLQMGLMSCKKSLP